MDEPEKTLKRFLEVPHDQGHLVLEEKLALLQFPLLEFLLGGQERLGGQLFQAGFVVPVLGVEPAEFEVLRQKSFLDEMFLHGAYLSRQE
jgi:hypothetical protein